jgi:uncharacterized protein DUF547
VSGLFLLNTARLPGRIFTPARCMALLTGAAVELILILPFCGMLFHCGCRVLWAGAARQCNIHYASSSHCPLCSGGNATFYGYFMVLIFGIQGLVFSVVRTRKVVPLLAVLLAAFFATGAGIGYLSRSRSTTNHSVAESPGPGSEKPAQRFAHDRLDRLLHKYVSVQGWVDYDGLNRDRLELNRYLADVANAEPKNFIDDRERLAFWINAYNASTLADVLDDVYNKVKSVRDVSGFFNRKKHDLAGMAMTLDEIEQHGRQLGDPRIHFALVCASGGCPRLQQFAYTGPVLDSQLDQVTRQFLQDTKRGARMDAATGELMLSSVFKWYAGDFTGHTSSAGRLFARVKATISGDSVLGFVAGYATPEMKTFITDKKPPVRYLDYDWSLNAQSTHTGIEVRK